MAHPLSIVPKNPKSTTPTNEYIVTPRRLAPYVLRAFARAQQQGKRCTLDDLCEQLAVRRSDLRRTVSALHASGMLDALRGRLTMQGLALSVTLSSRCEGPVRQALRGVEFNGKQTERVAIKYSA